MIIGFQTVIDYLKSNKININDKDLYEFGVCTGGSSTEFLKSLNENEITFNQYFGFDSWHGLPKETEGIFNPDVWGVGAFDATLYLKLPEKELTEYLINIFKRYTKSKINLISGFFDKSLTDSLIERYKMKPAFFVSIDVDIHKSCFESLDFLARNNLISKDTIIRYDEWGDFENNKNLLCKEFEFGESLAHKQIFEKYNLKCKTLFHGEGVKIIIIN